MPVFLVILAMPFIVLFWVVRYLVGCRERQAAEEMEAARKKAEFEARCARPFRDYVASLKPRAATAVPLRTVSVSSSPPTLGNIGRFTALTVCRNRDRYFVRDEEGNVFGPAEEAAMLQWIREDRIREETPVSSHEDGPWLPAVQVRALQPALQELKRGAIASNRFDHLQIK